MLELMATGALQVGTFQNDLHYCRLLAYWSSLARIWSEARELLLMAKNIFTSMRKCIKNSSKSSMRNIPRRMPNSVSCQAFRIVLPACLYSSLRQQNCKRDGAPVEQDLEAMATSAEERG